MTNKAKTKEDASFLPAEAYMLLLFSLSVYFAGRLVYFAFSVPDWLPPDEITHTTLITIFSKAWFLPHEISEADQALSLMAPYQPYAYYLLTGKLVHLNFFPIDDLTFIRLFSAVLGCITVFYGWRFIRLITGDQAVHILFVLVLTNTLMFTFISASASYDTLTNLAAAASIYYFADFWTNRTKRSLLLMLLMLLLGSLTKTSMLPLIFALTLCLVIHERKNLRTVKTHALTYWNESQRKDRTLLGLIALLLLLNIHLYGGNIVRFGKLVPATMDVLVEDQLYGHPGYARNYIYMAYLDEEMSFREGIRNARKIKNPSGARDTEALIVRAERLKRRGIVFSPLSRWAYALEWSERMLQSTVGLLGHRIIYRDGMELFSYVALFAVAGVLTIYRALQRKVSTLEWFLYGTVAFYIFVLMQVVSYPAYVRLQEIAIAIQGRYLFPIFLPICALLANSIAGNGSKRMKLSILFVLGIVLIRGDLFHYLSGFREY